MRKGRNTFKLLGLMFFCTVAFVPNAEAETSARISYFQEADSKIWILENDRLSFKLSFKDGAITPQTFYNKMSDINYLGGGSLLFLYKGQYIPSIETEVLGAANTFEFKSSDKDWILKDFSIEEIPLSAAFNDRLIGKRLSLVVLKEHIEISLVFEIFDGNSGLRYQSIIKNTHGQAIMIIEQSDVISFNLPKRAHDLHYTTNMKWLSTSGFLEESPINNQGKDVPKCLINLYSTNDGWYIAPEVNWKTQYGPEIPGSQGYEYMHRSFAHLTAWENGSGFVKVKTSPEALQLVLRPNEAFEYIAVNMTVFKGDIVDGKMAVEEHLQKRFRFRNTSTSFVVNDWDWFTQGLRTEDYYKSVVIPQAKKAGFEMIMFDDGWNNPNASGTGLNNDHLSRDPVEAGTNVISDMLSFTRYVEDQGLLFGLWYSMSGGNHNKGNDLAKKDVIAKKKEKIKYMLDNYGLSHQAVDLTQYWQNVVEHEDSYPSDNVYRKNVLTRNMINELVDEYPQYVVKVTSELDIFPTQGDRNTDLMHLPHNGWLTITGASGNIDVPGLFFGHLPMDAIYFGGNPTGKMSDYYTYMSARNVKVPQRPDHWSEKGVSLMSKFNTWRKAERIKSLTENIKRPVYWGKNWNSSIASQWSQAEGPYLWMHVSEGKTEALLLATAAGRSTLHQEAFPLRWLDASKTYLVEDITLDDLGMFTYAFVGKFSGEELNTEGFKVNLYQNTSGAKAFWIKEYLGLEKQVLYTDEYVNSYTEKREEDKLIVDVIGEKGGTGKLIVYGDTENDAMSVDVVFNQDGVGQVVVEDIRNNDVPFPGYSGAIRYKMENYHEDIELSNPKIQVSSTYNGNPDPENGYSSVIRMENLHDYVVYSLYVPFSGSCKFSVHYKVSKNSRGEAQLFYVGQDNEDVILGESFDQSTTDNEEMRSLVLGTIDIPEEGLVKIKMKLTGLGVSGSGKTISLNYLSIEKNVQ